MWRHNYLSMIFLTGHHNAGKSTAAKWLKEQYGFLHVETSSVVRGLYNASGTNLPFGEWATLNNNRFDREIIGAILQERELAIRGNGKFPDIIVTGNRQVEGIKFVTDRVQPLPGTENIILYVEASPRILHERHLIRRDRPTLRLTFDEFETTLLDFDRRMGVEEIREYAQVVVRNEATEQQFLSMVEGALRCRGYRLIPRL